MAKVTILAAPVELNLNKRDGSGTYTKRTQEAVIETSSTKVTLELDVEAGKSYPPGDYTCDMEAQLKPGRFGLELPRFWKLTPAKTAAALALG
jgi:hypothetical protein